MSARESRAKARTEDDLAGRANTHVLSAIDFQGGPGTGDLMDAVEILKDLNRAGCRKVPAGAPVLFVPARYAGYLTKARKSGMRPRSGTTGNVHRAGPPDGLRSGDVFVPVE